MIKKLDRGMNFSFSGANVTVEVNSRDNGLNLLAVLTDINKDSKFAAFNAPSDTCFFESNKKCRVTLPATNSSFEKIEFFAYNDNAQAVNATLIITQDNGERHEIDVDFANSSTIMFGRIYNHNGTWKAKNLADFINGKVDAVIPMYKGRDLAAALTKIKSNNTPQVQQQNNSAINMSPSQPSTQVQNGHINMSPTPQNGLVERMDSNSNLPTSTRPTFGRNRSNAGFSTRIEQGQEAASQTLNNAIAQGRSLFSRFANFSKNKAQEASDEVNKLRSKKLLIGVISACAYMAYADGEVSASEKQKALELMSNHQYLRLFDQKDVIECFESYIQCFENDFDEGEIYVFESLSPLKGSAEESNLILAVSLDIANADGIFSPEEEKALKRIRLILDA